MDCGVDAFLRMESPSHSKAGKQSVLGGGHDTHFPLYWEYADWLQAKRLTDADAADAAGGGRSAWLASALEANIVYAWRAAHDAPGAAAEGPVFKYKIGSEMEPLETRPLYGSLGMFAQKAIGRGGKRKPPAEITSVIVPRAQGAFGFGHIQRREMLLGFDGPTITNLKTAQTWENPTAKLLPSDGDDALFSEHAVIVNVAPICPFHFLLAPDLARMQPQAVTDRSLRVAAEVTMRCSPFLRMVFNSIGGGASVNHLHWQGLYLRTQLPIEKQLRVPEGRHDVLGVRVERLIGWPLPTWVFVTCEGSGPAQLVEAAWPLIAALLEHNLAHNLCLAKVDGALHLYVIPRKLASFPDPTKVQVASTEAFGFWVVPDADQYESLTEEEAMERMGVVAAWDDEQTGIEFVQSILSTAGWTYE